MADDFEFRAFMLQVSQRMTSNDFGQLKYLLKGYVSNAKCEEIKTVHDYFEELERMCLLGPKKFDVLKKALVSMGRQDLVEDVEQKEHYFARLFREKTGESLEQKEYDAVCDGTAEAAEELKPLPRSGQNAPELQEKLKLASLENGDKAQLEEISDMLGITYMSTAMTDLRKENKEVKKGDDLPLKKDKWSMQSKLPVEMRAGGGDEEEKVKPAPQMGNAESMEIPLEDTAPSNSNESAMEAEDHELESKTTEQALARVEKITLSTPNEKKPVKDTVLDELEDVNTTKDQVKHGRTEATIGAASSPQLGDEVVTDGKENDKDITADSKKDEIKSTSDEVKHHGPQHPHGPGARPKEPLFKKAKTAGLSGADKQMATEQADEVSETKPHGTLFVGPLHPEKTGSKVPTEDEDSDTWHPIAGNYSFPELIVGESTMDGQGQGACAAPIGCHHPPGVFSSKPTNQKASGYSDHAIPDNVSLLDVIQCASGLGLNIESSALQQPSYQLELLNQLLALQTGVSYAQGSSTYNAAAGDSPVRSNCYSKAGYSVVITNGDLCESTSEKGVFVMESEMQFCILIANSNNYAAEVDITFGGMWLGVWVVEAKQSLSTPLVIEGSSWAPGRLKFFSASDARKPQPSKDIYGDEPALNGKIELEFKPESKMLKVRAKHVRRKGLFEISIIETKTTTVGDLKQEIRKKWNSDISCLIKGEEVLQEEKTISSYALNENEVIGVLNVEEELMIESSGMNPIIMMVDPRNVSVEAVKHVIEKKIGIPVDEQILRFKGQDTEVDSKSLAQTFLKPKQSPVLKVDKDRIINIMVPDRKGKENKVEINWSATVDDLKEKPEERDICDIDAKLTFGDKEISRQGDKKLIDLGFKNQSKISQTRSSTSGGFSGRTFDGSGGSNLRGFGGFGVFDDFSSSSSTLRGFTKGTRAFRSSPKDAEDSSSEYGKEDGVLLHGTEEVFHGTEENVHKNFQIDGSGQKFAKEKAVTLVIQLIAKSVHSMCLGNHNPGLPSLQSQEIKNTFLPQEIQARGHRAEAAFKEAMEKGSVEVYRGRIMLIGQDRAGKTSLKKFLLGIPFDPEEESTVGIKVDPTKFEVEIDQVKNWQFTNHSKLDLSEYREDIAKITAEYMKALEGESQETTDSMDLEQELNDPSRLQDVIVLPKTEEDAEGRQQSHASPTIDSNQGSKAEIDPTAGLTLNDVTEEVEQCLQGLELNGDVKAKEVILSVWDFAGQNLYYASHSVFLSHRAVYVLVHNLSKDLSAQAEPYAKHETRKIELENPTNQTNLDNLLSWLVSVHCIRPTRDEASEVLEEKEGKCPPYLRPPIFVVGTHADKPFKDIKDMLQYIQDSVSGKRYDGHVIRPLYAIDNMRSASDYGVQALQNRISEVLKQEPYMGEKVPIRWFHFEKIVEALVANKIYHMDLNELLKHTKRLCHIDKEEELKTMLNFYHDLGVIAKYGRTVVLQALWLIDLFKQLINVRPYDERDPRYSCCWQELKEKGILRMDLVDHVFIDFIQEDLSKQDILKMMEDYGLIAKFSFLPADGDHQQEYFVPSLLKSLPLGLYEIKPSNCDPCPLYLHFLDGFVPHGLFAQLVSRCIVWCSGCSPEIPELYQNGAMFFIGKQPIFDLVFICRKRFIKIILARNPQASAPSTTCSATKAREVRVFLEGTLKGMREELSWLRNVRYELCVACTHCLKSRDQCSRHNSVHCADDDCLYLLPLRPEEQLICRKNYAREPIKIYGLEKWLLVHEKEVPSEKQKMVSGNPKGSDVKQRTDSPCTSLKRLQLTPGGPVNRADAVKERSPENDDLERLANQIINEWKKLGRRLLGSDEALIDEVHKDNDKCSEKAYKMLLKWKAAKGSDATFRVLHDALCHDIVNRRDLAEKFCLVTDD